MGTEAENNEQEVTEGEASKEQEPENKEEKPQVVTMEMIEELRNENAQLKEFAAKAQRDAAASQDYAQRIVSEIKLAAERGGGVGYNQQEQPDLREQLNDNPEEVLDRHFYTRMKPLIEQNLGYQVQTARTLFEQRHEADEDFRAYKDELEEFMKGIPPEVKANPAAWDNAMDFVRAKHLKEIVERRTKKQSQMDQRAFAEPPSGSSPGRASKASLSDDQKAIAKGLGLSEDEYREFLTP